MTAEDLLARQDDGGWRYEVVEGVLFRVAGSGQEATTIGFYVAERRSLIADRTKPIPFAPDLAVEFASPTQRTHELAAKVMLYLQGGTRLVWIVWPRYQRIDIWRVGCVAPVATLRTGDMLSDEDVVPGFALPVSDVFADPLG